MRQQAAAIKYASYIFLIISSFIMIYPVLFMVLGSFTTNERFLEAVILPIPNTLNVDFFKRAWQSGVEQAYVWTLVIVAFRIAVTLVVGLTGGYIFSKMRFPGKNKVFMLFLSGMVMPGILMLVPTYLMMAWWPFAGGNNWLGQGGHGFVGDWKVLFILGLVPVGAIFLFKQSYDMLPTEYEDAAKMDGAGILTIIFRVYGPLLKPPIVALVILTFLGVWGDYLWPSLTLSGHPDLYPIALRMRSVMIAEPGQLGVTTTNFPAEMIRTFLAVWPAAAVYFILQRYFVQGFVAAGVKG